MKPSATGSGEMGEKIGRGAGACGEDGGRDIFARGGGCRKGEKGFDIGIVREVENSSIGSGGIVELTTGEGPGGGEIFGDGRVELVD